MFVKAPELENLILAVGPKRLVDLNWPLVQDCHTYIHSSKELILVDFNLTVARTNTLDSSYVVVI